MTSEYRPMSAVEMSRYVISERLGYLGKKRDEKLKELNLKLSEGKWMIGWVVGENLFWENGKLTGNPVILDYVRACKLYEDAYFAHFQAHPDELEFVVNNAAEVFDNSETNINSGLEYLNQEESSTHIQDIAIRNVLPRFGKSFKGAEPLQIRIDGVGEKWNPANILFHRQEWFVEPRNAKDVWWVRERYKAREKSVECFWQSNKFVLVKK